MPELASRRALLGTQRPLGTGAGVAAVGACLPPETVGNEPIAVRLGVSTDWIEQRTGVRERHVASGEGVVELASAAGREALDAAGVAPADVDLLLVATMTHEFLTPSAAPLVSDAIGCHGAGAIDVGAACTGFVSALSLAAAQVESGRSETVLVIGADVVTSIVDPDDRSTAALFGDGAGAAVVCPTAGPGRIGPFVLGADGSRAELVRAPREPALISMQGHDTFRQAVDHLAQVSLDAVAAAGSELADVDLFVYHQANGRILRAVGERLGAPAERVVDCIHKHGNTSAASIPLALADAVSTGQLQPGSRVLLAGFGGGLTWGATVVDWGLGEGGAVTDAA